MTDWKRNGKAKIPRRTESGRKEDNMAKFKVGDRVRIIDKIYTDCKVGDTGIIKYIHCSPSSPMYAVEFDREDRFFSSCTCHTKDNRGQWVCSDNIELIKPEFKLVVISKGDKTKAKLYRGESLEKEIEVNRYHKDEYSEKATVEAVTKKIFGEGEKKTEKKDELFNGVAVCLIDRDCPKFTRGRTYTFVNGNCWNDKGNVMAYGYTKKEIANSIWFLPIVE